MLPERTREQAAIIRQNGEKLRHLILNLNLTSKLEYSMQPLQMTRVYPVELAREVITDFLNNGLEDIYTLDIESGEGTAAFAIQGDSSLLERMLENLIRNSTVHNPKGCHITVAISRIGNQCQYMVSDDGMGISQMQMEEFNNGFFTEKGDRDDIKHGWGLRLVYQIVQAHKGRIRFEKNVPSGLIVSIII